MGAGAYLAAHELTRNGKFIRGPIVVGADCTVGPCARLTPHVTVEAGSNVPALACACRARRLACSLDSSFQLGCGQLGCWGESRRDAGIP